MTVAIPEAPLSTAELVALAQGDELPAALRESVAAYLDALPEAAEGLRAAGDNVPEPPAADPFVSALRRLAWPSERLPMRHRRAATRVGREPLSFLRLVVEEARTFSWRSQSPDALSAVAGWLAPWARDQDSPEPLELAGRALGYRNLVAMVTFDSEKLETLAEMVRELVEFVQSIEGRCQNPIEVEGVLSMQVLNAYLGPQILEGLEIAEVVQHLSEGKDTVILAGFLEGYTGGVLRDEEDVAVDAYLKALALCDGESDPWLEFFLRYSVARVLVNASTAEVPDLQELMSEAKIELAEHPAIWHQRKVRPDEVMFSRFLTAHQAEYRLRREPALRHLEAIEPLFHEFRTPAMAVEYYWLLVECHRAFDGYKALDYCCDAVLAAEELNPSDPEIEHMLVTAALIRYAMADYGHTSEVRQIAVDRRVAQILAPRLNLEIEKFKAKNLRSALGRKSASSPCYCTDADQPAIEPDSKPSAKSGASPT